MISSIFKFVVMVGLVFGITAGSLPDDTGTVSIVGKNVDGTDTKTFGLMLVLADKTWREFEPENRSHYFKTKSGIYIYVPGTNTVLLCDKDKVLKCARSIDSQVGQLLPLTPSTAKKGDHGTGQAEETGISFSWDVK